MKFPLDNEHRTRQGVKTGAIHDMTGKIVMNVCRVNLPKNPGETLDSWREREVAATVQRASSIVKTLNACYALVKSMGKHEEQPWLPGIDSIEDEDSEKGEEA